MFDLYCLSVAAAALAFALFSLRAARRPRRTVAQLAALRLADDCQ